MGNFYTFKIPITPLITLVKKNDVLITQHVNIKYCRKIYNDL